MMRRKNLSVMAFSITLIFGLGWFIPSSPAQETQPTAVKVVEVKEVKLKRGTAQAVIIYRADGKPLSITIRADKGVIVCSHFDLNALESHGVAAAMVQGIKSIEEALETRVVKVNQLAEALGVRPEMPVQEALGKMM